MNPDANAFPSAWEWSEKLNTESGLTKRELFAAMALQGILSNRNCLLHKAPELAVKQADLLIEELSKTNLELEG